MRGLIARTTTARGRSAPVPALVLALMLGLVLLGGVGCTSDEPPTAAPPRPRGTSPAASQTPERPTPTQVVDSPRSRLAGYASRPDRPGVAAAAWRLCRARHRCANAPSAIVVTADGFASRAVLALPIHRDVDVEWIAGDDFVVYADGWRPRWLASANGTLRPISWAGERGPLASTEVLLQRGGDYYGLDAPTAVAHRLSTPRSAAMLVEAAGQLRGITLGRRPGHDQYVWSSDRGAHWHRAALPSQTSEPSFLAPVSIGVGAEHVLVQGADGATLFPFVAILRSPDPATEWTSTPGPRDPMAYVGPLAVLPDGRLLVVVQAWSNERHGRPGAKLPGLWVSTDESWARLERLPAGGPFAGRAHALEDLLELVATPEGARVVASADSGRAAYVSTDLGRTWRRVPAR